MKSFALFAAAAFSTGALAHWNYDQLIVDGAVVGDRYQYIRQTTNSNSPITDVESDDMRCNQGGSSGNNTQTYTVAAGTSIGFVINSEFGHPGPQQVYMSKAPSTAAEYDGSGDWFKIWAMSTTTNYTETTGMTWATNGMTNFTFDIPAETPAGEYLVRAEGLALHGASTYGGAQWYIGCAQINVSGNNSTTSASAAPSPTVKIPGYLTGNESSVLLNIYYPVPMNYSVPGPALWPSTTEVLHEAE